MRRMVLLTVFTAVLLLPVPVLFADEPVFVLYSGDDESISSADIQGHLVLLFYEAKNKTEVNRELKDTLENYSDRLMKIHPDAIVLGVGDCTKAKRPFIGLWKKGLKKSSRKSGRTIYGDWDGKIADIYNLDKKNPNFLIINHDGKIIYRNSGSIKTNEISKILKILTVN